MKEIKQQLYLQLEKQLDKKIETAKEMMQSAADSRDKETKSSVGDKYETGRAMMQLEYEKNEMQLLKALELKKRLTSINITKENSEVVLGSLVITNQGNYFISIGLGKVMIDSTKYFAISVLSPIGQLLLTKTIGATVTFNKREIKIAGIY